MLESLVKLKENGVYVNALTVITKLNSKHADDIYFFFKNLDVDFKTSPCNFAEDANLHDISMLSLSPVEYGDFLINLAKIYLNDENPTIRIIDLDDIIKSFFLGYNSNCMFSGQCHEFFGVTPEGDVYVCDLFGQEEFHLGNLNEVETIDKFLAEKIFIKNNILRKIKLRSNSLHKCKKCKYFPICKGGCLSNSYFLNRNIYTEDYYCKSRLKLFSYIEKVLKQSYEIQLIKIREGR